MSDTKLLPCPHCGGPGQQGDDYDCWTVVCAHDCLAHSTQEEGAAAWNRRSPPAPCPTCAEYDPAWRCEPVPVYMGRDRYFVVVTTAGLRFVAWIDGDAFVTLLDNGQAHVFKNVMCWMLLPDLPPAPCATQEDTPVCESCAGTGWYGDNGPGRKGNAEAMPCDQCTPKVERQAWPVRRDDDGRHVIVAKGDGWCRAIVGDGYDGWTCVGFAYTDEERDSVLADETWPALFPVREDGTPARWAIMVRRNDQALPQPPVGDGGAQKQ